MTKLELTLFGGFTAAVSGRLVTDFRTDKMRALLIYLAVNEERPYRRDLLATLLWSEWSDADARRNLRQTLHRLTRLLDELTPDLGSDLFITTRQTVQLNKSAVTLDVAQFLDILHALESHTHSSLSQCSHCLKLMQQAADIYQGNFLEGFTVSEADSFEEWFLMQREQLQQRYLELLDRLAQAFEKQGANAYSKAQIYASQQVALAPWRETAHRQLMRLYMLQGKRNEALAQYQNCRNLLAQELGVEPSPETEALWHQIKEGDFQSTPIPEKPAAGFPTQLTPFVGRREEIAQIKANLVGDDCHLLTLIGPGGIGKTRLSIEAGKELSGQYRDGACFIPLTAVSNQSMMVNTIAQRLGIQLTEPVPPQQQLLAYLQAKEMLLVCDNFEQLIDSAAFLGEIMAQSPGVRLLVTSRQPLNLRAEWRQTVTGLDYSQGEKSEAVRLFKRNARRVSPQFQLDADDLTAVLDLCHLVEGMPLALEIAAAWTRLMDCPTILRETQKSLAFLTSPLGDLPDRHRSVQAVLTQSWEMLSTRLQTILGRLALFGGSFTLEAAQAVVADLSMLDIATLLDRSLIHWRSNGRYQMHELLRQFVRGQSFSEPDDFRGVYSRYYLTLIAKQEEQLVGAEPRQAIAAVEQEIANIRLAWRWAVEQGAAGLLENSLNALLAYYEFQGSYDEGREQFAAAANALPPSVLVNRLCLAEASFRQRLGDLPGALALVEGVIESGQVETKLAALIALARLDEKRSEYDTAIELLQEALALAGPNSREAAEIWTILGSIYSYRGPMEKRIEAHKKALAINVALADRLQTAECHNMLSMIYKDLGEYAEAMSHIEQALEIAEEMNHRESISRFTQKQGLVYWRMDELEQARNKYEKSLAIAQEINHKRLISISSGGLGVLAKRRREYDVALRYYNQSVQLAKEIDDKSIQAVYLGNTGNAYMDLGQYDRAINTLKEAAELDQSMGAVGGVARHRANIGDAYKFQGMYEEALPYFEAAITPIREIEGNYYLCWVLVSYAQCLLALDRVEEARAANQEGGKVAAEIDRSFYLLMSLLLDAQMDAAEGKLDDVEEYFDDLRRRFTTSEMIAEIDEMQWHITGDTAARELALESLQNLYEETKRERFRWRAANLS